MNSYLYTNPLKQRFFKQSDFAPLQNNRLLATQRQYSQSIITSLERSNLWKSYLEFTFYIQEFDHKEPTCQYLNLNILLFSWLTDIYSSGLKEHLNCMHSLYAWCEDLMHAILYQKTSEDYAMDWLVKGL